MNKEASTNYRAYLDRFVFAVGLSTGLRLSALHELTINQMTEERLWGVPCIVFRTLQGGSEGESKNESGGWEGAGQRANVFPIPNEILLGGRVNFYSLIKEYLSVRRAIKADSKRFFLGVKIVGKDLHLGDPKKFNTKLNLGKNLFNAVFKGVSENLSIR